MDIQKKKRWTNPKRCWRFINLSKKNTSWPTYTSIVLYFLPLDPRRHNAAEHPWKPVYNKTEPHLKDGALEQIFFLMLDFEVRIHEKCDIIALLTTFLLQKRSRCGLNNKSPVRDTKKKRKKK